MIDIYCFSGSGHSFRIAEYFEKMLNSPIQDITDSVSISSDSDTAIVIFPIYCQNIPKLVKRFISALSVKYIVFIATYGRFSHGNVLHEAAKITNSTVIAAAYIPCSHSYLNEEFCFDYNKLTPIINRIREPHNIEIPFLFKNPFALFFPNTRSRIGVKITKNDSCTSCGLCSSICPMQSINNGIISNKCIRCLRCVKKCPVQCLDVSLNLFLRIYLKGKRKNDLILYI